MHFNLQARSRADEDSWPPDKPKNFTPLVLIQHHNKRTMKQATEMYQYIERGYVSEFTNKLIPRYNAKPTNDAIKEILNTSTITKEIIAEVLAPLEINDTPQFIMIEGAPGIGNSILLKEIAYRWASKQILQKFKLVILICLRDPTLQQIMSVSDLFQCFCKGDKKAAEIATGCGNYFLETGGKDITFLFDGFDELDLQEDSLIANILSRHILPFCDLVVSSRPHTSVKLRIQATISVEILGFTETEREHYVHQALNGDKEKIKEVIQYLRHHLTISSLCFVPINMVILLFLYKQGICLPASSTELYEHFICLTIY